MKVKVDIDFQNIKRNFAGKKSDGLHILKNAVIRDTDEYVPYSNMQHTHMADTPRLNKEEDKIIYDTVYANKLYKGRNLNFNKSQHPKATYEWLEASKAKNMKNWTEAVKGVYKDGK